MNLGLGWVLLFAGVAGFVKSMLMSTFSWSDDETAEKKPLSKGTRALLLGINALLILLGSLEISRERNWNPFHPCPTCNDKGGPVSHIEHWQKARPRRSVQCIDRSA
jgi:hypothetical protein